MIKTFKAFFRILDRQDKKKIASLFFLLSITGLLSFLSLSATLPFLYALVSPDKNWIDRLFPIQRQENILFLSLLLIVFVFWIKNTFSYYCLRIQTKILYGLAYKIAQKLFQNYMEAPYIWHLNRSTSELIRNVTGETHMLATGILEPLGSLTAEAITSLFILIVLLYINIKFTLMVSCLLFLFMLLFMYLTRRKVAKYGDDRVKTWNAMTKDVMQGIGGIKESKIYELERYLILSFNKHSHIANFSSAFSSVYSQTPRLILETVAITIVILAIACLLWFGHSNNQIILLLSVFGVATMQLLPSSNRFMTSLTTIKYSFPALTIIVKEFNNTTPSSSEIIIHKPSKQSINFQKILRIEQVSFAYPEGKVALDDVTLAIKKDLSVAFVGRSGAGKTTLADIILGLLNCKSGKILIDEIELTEDNLRSWHQHLGYIPQSIYLYDCTVKENVAFGIPFEKIDEQKVWQALDTASLKEFVETMPKQLNTQIGENGIRLSGGQRQRIGIARALYRNPDVLIMDEATAALDNQTEKEVTQAIQKATKNRTLITIAHRLSTIKNSDVIFMMDQGKIVSHGSYDALIEQCDLFKNLMHPEMYTSRT